MNDFNKFIYKKVQIIQENYTYYYWYLINKELRNGVHFHGVKRHDSEEYFKLPFNNNQYGFETLGIESHSKEPLYEGHKPIPNCDVTGGDCYCDGTSLYASEKLGDINPDKCDERVWFELHYLYKNWHEGKCDE